MTPFYEDDDVQLYLDEDAGCLGVLPSLPDASVDAICTDPPYELAFMGRAWDSSGIAYNVDVWRECLRVLKPGGHLLAFGGTRTYHRMACAIEDAGFEIRDSLHWLYGSGFPKGQDIAKSIDKRRDDRDAILRVTAWLAAARDAAGWTTARIDDLFGFNGMASHWTAITSKAASVPTPEQWDRLREALGFDDAEVRPLVAELNGRRGTLGEAWVRREVIGQSHRVRRPSDVQIAGLSAGTYDLTAPGSDAARRWQGWNTALKPGHEPIVLARKSTGFNTTVANVLEHGTGALNIDACRTTSPVLEGDRRSSACPPGARNLYGTGWRKQGAGDRHNPAGRWPANVLLSHAPLLDEDGQPVGDACASGCVPGCPVAELDRQSGVQEGGSWPKRRSSMGYGGGGGTSGGSGHRDAPGGASRFFPTFRYEAKAPAAERPRLPDGTAHPTVKPLSLMRWLVRLVTPPGGLVLDPFAGTGTTLEAAVIEGFHATGIEIDQAHADLCRTRLDKPIAATFPGLDP